MQPMVSAGKLFEPKLQQQNTEKAGNEVLQPTFERQRSGPRITVNDDEGVDTDGRSFHQNVVLN